MASGAITKAAVAVAIMGLAAAGAANPADPRCAGGPYALPPPPPIAPPPDIPVAPVAPPEPMAGMPGQI
jgi:hypothetical protein